jgi:hypothetical protein
VPDLVFPEVGNILWTPISADKNSVTMLLLSEASRILKRHAQST